MASSSAARHPHQRIALLAPRSESPTSVEGALLQRRSVREFKGAPLALAEISQLLWAAQGKTDPGGLRTSPSAGALYPLEIYLLAGNVVDLASGIYHYIPNRHELIKTGTDDQRAALCRAALDQSSISEAAAVLILCGVYERTTQKYGKRGIRYVHMEAGHTAQNVFLQAVSLQMGTVVIGAFEDDRVRAILGLSDREHPLYLMPIGKR